MIMSDSGQKAIKRNRPPRVHIAYQDPYDESAQVELPFVAGVMADLSGNASAKDKPKIAERPFSDVDPQNFNKYMSSVEPALSFQVGNKLGSGEGEKLGIDLTFKSMEDLDPGRIARQVPALKTLLEAREQLANLQRYMNGKSGAQDLLRKLLSDPELMKLLETRSGEGAAPAGGGTDDKEDGTA
jgi:type VI secretion system protein ImpB